MDDTARPRHGEPPAHADTTFNPSVNKRERSALIYCGLCGALNPSSNHFCAACGTTLVDAFHASEGLRVFERPDAASRLIEIVPTGTELDIVEDSNAPADYVRIRLAYGRLGYIRLADVAELANVGALDERAIRERPDPNTRARGCVTPGAALGSLALMLVTTAFFLILLVQWDNPDAGILGVVFCVAIVPLLIMTVAFYLYARGREEREEHRDDRNAG